MTYYTIIIYFIKTRPRWAGWQMRHNITLRIKRVSISQVCKSNTPDLLIISRFDQLYKISLLIWVSFISAPETFMCNVCVGSSRQERAADICSSGRGSLCLALYLWLMNSSLKQYVHAVLLQSYHIKFQLTGAWWSQWDDLLQLKSPSAQPAGAFPELRRARKNQSTSE